MEVSGQSTEYVWMIPGASLDPTAKKKNFPACISIKPWSYSPQPNHYIE